MSGERDIEGNSRKLRSPPPNSKNNKIVPMKTTITKEWAHPKREGAAPPPYR